MVAAWNVEEEEELGMQVDEKSCRGVGISEFNFIRLLKIV